VREWFLPRQETNINRQRVYRQQAVFYSNLLCKDFLGASPVYDEIYFKRFFKLPIALFDNIVEKLVIHDDYFCQKFDAAGRLGLSPLQKIALAIRQPTSGVSSNELDDKYCMAGASTGLEAMKRFCQGVNAVYSGVALCHPTLDHINILLDEGMKSSFPGCSIWSIDCSMHWGEWKNCPSAWKGRDVSGY
jgi:Plant transposon protein